MRLTSLLHKPSVGFSIGLGFLLLSVSATAIIGQMKNPPVLRITDVDTAQFPDVTLSVYGQNLGTDLAQVPITVQEDGKDQAITRRDLINVGTQTAFLIDSSGSINTPGLSGIARIQEVRNALKRLAFETKIFTPTVDLMAAYAPASDGKITTIQEWTLDHGGLANAVSDYQVPEGVQSTPLFDLLNSALDGFNEPNLDSRAQRAIVVFSDGVDVVSSLQIDDAINRAVQMNIPIFTVLLGKGSSTDRGNLERIAIKTEGKLIELSGTESLDSLWNQLAEGRQQRQISYRSRSSKPTQVGITAELPAGGTQEATKPFPPVALQPVEISVETPQSGLEIIKEAPAFDTKVEDLEPKVLDVKTAFSWPDELPRNIHRVEYMLGDDTHTRESEPFDQISLPIDKLDQGNYTLRVRAVDELGIVGESKPVALGVIVQRPPDTQDWQSVITWVALGIGLIALLVAIIVLFRKPAVREQTMAVVTNRIKAATEPFFRGPRQKAHVAAKAKLIMLEGPSTLPPEIELHSSNTRIGRDPELSNVVLNDPRVSRYHCRIAEVAEGQFHLYDEGSMSGTYVNLEQVGIGGHLLKSGDQIHVGPVSFRFESNPTGPEPKDITEPYQPKMG